MLDRFLARLRAAGSSEEGQTFIEYVVVAAVAIVLVLAAIQAFFGGLASVWQHLTQMVTGVG